MPQHHFYPCYIVPMPTTAICTSMIPLQLDSVYIFQFWWVSLSRFVLLPDFPAWLSASISGATWSLTQRWAKSMQVQKHKGWKALYFVTAWRYFTEIWNVLRLTNWKTSFEFLPSSAPRYHLTGLYPLKQTDSRHMYQGASTLQHVWKWFSFGQHMESRCFSKRIDGIQAHHNLSTICLQACHPPPPYMLSHTKWSSKTHYAFSCLHSSLHLLFS